MDQLKNLWAQMSLWQRVSLGVVILATAGTVAWVVSWRKESNFKPLYQGMEGADAAQAVQKLKESGIEVRLGEVGNTILVPSEKLAEGRLLLAREGLPKSGRIGFEIFDKTNFGTSDFAEHINYRRALEGELERTIASIGEVERARVHLTFPKESIFVESRQPAKASVMLTLRKRSNLSPANVTAITYLVASAVEGLAPTQVTLVDTAGGLLNKPRSGDLASAAGPMPDSQLEYRMAVEKDLLHKLSESLDPVLGPGRYRTGVSVDCDFAGVEESEEILDPTKSVMVTSQRSDESGPSGLGAAGLPGTASNLPNPPVPRAATGAGVSRHTENSTFQTSRRVRHVQQPRGNVKRITVAVLLDQEVRWERKGKDYQKTFVPPAAERLSVIRNMVTNVVGLDTARGDQITVESLPFDTTPRDEAPVDPQAPKTVPGGAFQWQTLDRRYLIGGAVVLILCLAAGGWLMKKRSAGRKKLAQAAQQLPPVQGGLRQIAGSEAAGSVSLSNGQPTSTEIGKIEASPSTNAEVLTLRIRQEIQRDPRAVTQLLRTWLTEDES